MQNRTIRKGIFFGLLLSLAGLAGCTTADYELRTKFLPTRVSVSGALQEMIQKELEFFLEKPAQNIPASAVYMLNLLCSARPGKGVSLKEGTYLKEQELQLITLCCAVSVKKAEKHAVKNREICETTLASVPTSQGAFSLSDFPKLLEIYSDPLARGIVERVLDLLPGSKKRK